MATPADVLGSRLKAWFAENYSAGTWVSETGTVTNLAQATSGNRPTATTTPGGRTCLQFDGTNDSLTGAAISGLPTYNSSSGQWMEFLAFARGETGTSADRRIVNDSNSDEYIILFGGQLWRWGARSNANITNTNWHTLILLGTASGGNVKMYLDGTLQTTQGTGTLGSLWQNAKGVGCRHDNNTEFFNGKLASLGFAQTATTFSGTDISDLHAALNSFINDAPGGGGNIAGSSSFSFTPTGTVKGKGKVAGSSTMTFTCTGTVKGLARVAGSSTLTFSPTADVRPRVAVSGSSTMTFTCSGTVKGKAAVSGSSTMTFAPAGTVKGNGKIAGSSSFAFAPSGAVKGKGAVTGSSSWAFAPSGTIKGKGTIAGSSSWAFTCSGSLNQPGASIAGSSSWGFTCTGTVKGIGRIAGGSTTTFSPTATVKGTARVAGASTMSFTCGGSVRGSGRIAGASALSFTPSAIVKGLGRIAGHSAWAFSLTGTVVDAEALALVPIIQAATISGRLTQRSFIAGLITQASEINSAVVQKVKIGGV